MTIAALILALVALLAAFLAMRRINSLQQHLARANSTAFELRGALNEMQEQMGQQLTELRLSLRQQAGEAIFRPDMTIAEALTVHPKATEALASFHLGGCSQCAVSDVDTLEGACQTYGLDEKALMAALNGLIDGGSAGASAPKKTPNVKLNF